MTDATTAARPRICFVVSSPQTVVAFLNSHIARLRAQFEVSVIANARGDAASTLAPGLVTHIPIERTVKPWADVKALVLLRRTLRQREFDAIISVTPKAGLLTALASVGTRTPIRIHWFTGQVWATRSGVKRALLKELDRFVARRSTVALVDSRSQRAFLLREGVLSEAKSLVLANGSICGVDTERFHPDAGTRRQVRGELALPEGAVVILFVGRITRDKGVHPLAEAFAALPEQLSPFLLLVGPDEEGLWPDLRRSMGDAASRASWVGARIDPERLMAASDVFCLPSFREGFGLSVIEAGACALPSVASAIYGLEDAVEDGVTGILVPAGDAVALNQALRRIVENPALRIQMGSAARDRVQRDFATELLSAELEQLLMQSTSDIPTPANGEPGIAEFTNG